MPPHHPVLDVAVAYPKIAELRSLLTAQDWSAARTMLDVAEPVERDYLIRAGSEVAGCAELLRGVLAGDPADSAAAAMLGQHLIAAAWAIRTAARAQHVGKEQFARFHDGLRQAEMVLIDAAARTPDDPAVWSARLTTARGLELGQSEARRRYDRLAEVSPHHLPGQLQLLQQLCPKWSGSWEKGHAFAREAAAAAPEGALNAVLIPEVHIEHWLELEGAAARRAYVMSDAVRGEVYEAARRSVWHPEFRRTHGWVLVMNTFAAYFAMVDDMPAVGSLFTALGDLATESPWRYLGDPATVISQFRARALPAGSPA
ncbi:hypothetical protein [Actinoplanes sp. L3-i22]|uniref:hypothetical protein n=1 Tax=Actinoplanes sp. L3-i22 TaxID=2836373 RepID=UPI0021044CC4|nr:hypothetical protein [Actinoplanes sp. L3-i22]